MLADNSVCIVFLWLITILCAKDLVNKVIYNDHDDVNCRIFRGFLIGLMFWVNTILHSSKLKAWHFFCLQYNKEDNLRNLKLAFLKSYLSSTSIPRRPLGISVWSRNRWVRTQCFHRMVTVLLPAGHASYAGPQQENNVVQGRGRIHGSFWYFFCYW